MSKEKPQPTPPELQPTLPGFVIKKLPGGYRKGRFVFPSPVEIAMRKTDVRGTEAQVELFRRVRTGEVDPKDEKSRQKAIDEVVDYQPRLF